MDIQNTNEKSFVQLLQLIKNVIKNCKSVHPSKMDKNESDDKLPEVKNKANRQENVSVNSEKVINLISEEEEEEAENDLNFQDLPFDCKLKIFSYLNPIDRANCERVCKDWKEVVRCRSLWSDVHFSSLFMEPLTEKQSKIHNDTELIQFDSECSDVSNLQKLNLERRKLELEKNYDLYKSRVTSFINYLKTLNPCLKEFSFAFDIGDAQDNWGNLLKGLIDTSVLKNLKKASLNWKETPAKPFLLQDSSNTWSNSNYSDLIYKHRRRQRSFISFFDHFTLKVSNLEYLSLPFDWSASSVSSLCRLGHCLKELHLEEYFVPQQCVQTLINQLLSSLVNLEKLTLSLVLGSGSGVICYEINSPSLKYLDISKCQGLSLIKIKMPKLEVLIMNNQSYQSQFCTGSEGNLVVNEQRQIQPLTKSVSISPSPSSTAPPRPLRSHSSSPALPPLSSSLPESTESPSLSSFPIDSSPVRRRHSDQPPLSPLLAPTPSLLTSIPCLYKVLLKGAPNLKRLNNYSINYNQDVYQESASECSSNSLNSVLQETCTCLLHSKPTF